MPLQELTVKIYCRPVRTYIRAKGSNSDPVVLIRHTRMHVREFAGSDGAAKSVLVGVGELCRDTHKSS